MLTDNSVTSISVAKLFCQLKLDSNSTIVNSMMNAVVQLIKQALGIQKVVSYGKASCCATLNFCNCLLKLVYFVLVFAASVNSRRSHSAYRCVALSVRQLFANADLLRDFSILLYKLHLLLCDTVVR
jgi:hypothetical protein